MYFIPVSTMSTTKHFCNDQTDVQMGMMKGADISVGQYIGRSVVPSFIGNSGYPCEGATLTSPVLGGCLRTLSTIFLSVRATSNIPVGIPMVLMYQPPSLPSFLKRSSSETSLATLSEVPTRQQAAPQVTEVHVDEAQACKV